MHRTALIISFFLLLAVTIPTADGGVGDSRTLSFYHTHTHKTLTVTYYENGDYVPGSLADLRVFLSDWRNGHQYPIDPGVMDILWEIQQVTENDGAYEVISAYRSPDTNTLLRKNSKGVAKKSQHLKGKAIDVRLPGTDTSRLRDIALELRLGGVGYYEQSDFVHVDTGRVRRW
jgi:uncharacterized protein YcbK (DUF882 family)